MKRKIVAWNLWIILLMVVISCDKKNKESDPTPDDNGGNANTPKGMLAIHLHNYLDVTEIDGYNIVYTTSGGRKVSFTKAQFYLSEFELVKLDGTILPIADKYILKLQETQSYQLGQIPVGNYKGIRFKVGLNSTLNASTPASSSSDILNRPDMWFGSAAQPDGFVFFHLAGKIDTTVASNGLTADMVPFEYKIGTNTHLKSVVMPEKNFSILIDQVEYLHMYADLSKIFEGIQLHVNSNLTMTSASDNSNSLGTSLFNNVGNIFLYEE